MEFHRVFGRGCMGADMAEKDGDGELSLLALLLLSNFPGYEIFRLAMVPQSGNLVR